MRWDDFRELCETDAYNWYNYGWRSNELEIKDIINDYPKDYFNDSPDDDFDEFSGFFTPEEIAEKTMERLKEIEKEEKEKEEKEKEEEEE